MNLLSLSELREFYESRKNCEFDLFSQHIYDEDGIWSIFRSRKDNYGNYILDSLKFCAILRELKQTNPTHER